MGNSIDKHFQTNCKCNFLMKTQAFLVSFPIESHLKTSGKWIWMIEKNCKRFNRNMGIGKDLELFSYLSLPICLTRCLRKMFQFINTCTHNIAKQHRNQHVISTTFQRPRGINPLHFLKIFTLKLEKYLWRSARIIRN